MALVLLLAFSLLFQGALGSIICEELPAGLCSFSISSSGKRCLLENYMSKDGNIGYQCKTSEVVVDINIMREWIETDECVSACGVDRNTVGISSDSLIQPQFTAKLCSQPCYEHCPNIVNLYYNLAMGEGVYLPGLCEALRTSPRRAMSQIQSSGVASGPSLSAAANGPAASAATADGPVSSESNAPVKCAPAPASA